MTAEPVWFGPEERPLAGWLHLPADNRSTGAVLLCPPIGRDHLVCYGTFRRLASRLAEQGVAALRFDYDGTGDSAGEQSDPGRVRAWIESIHAGLACCRELGCSSIAVVGMRLGATLAASALADSAEEATVDALVLWDPCATGRSFLREQQILAIASGSVSEPQGGSIETLGFSFSKETGADLSQISIAGAKGPLARRILVLERIDQPRSAALAERFSSSEIEWLPAEGQDLLLDVSAELRRVPTKTMGQLCHWLAGHVVGEERALTMPPAIRRGDTATAVSRSREDQAVVERHLTFGERKLFGVVSSPSHPHRALPRLIFLNVGNLHHIGPGRLWVDLARSLASVGFSSIRMDLTGLGDSPAETDGAREKIFPARALEDIRCAADAISPDDPANVVIIGLSAGGRHAVALALVATVRAIVLINPALTLGIALADTGQAETAEDLRALNRRRLFNLPGVRWLVHDLRPKRAMPGPLKWLAYRTVLRQQPLAAIERLGYAGTEVLFIASQTDFGQLVGAGMAHAARRLQRSEHISLRVVPTMDHMLERREDRIIVSEIVTDQLCEWFAADSETGDFDAEEIRGAAGH